jgi:hypothetical protein
LAPRRLIIVMLVLLAFSTALAILIPEPRQAEPPQDQPAGQSADRPVEAPDRRPAGKPRNEAGPAQASSGAGRTLERSVRAGGPVERIATRPGDRLILEVRSGRPILIEVEGAGLTDPAGPYDPARFDLLIGERSDRLIVREIGSPGRRIALIETG